MNALRIIKPPMQIPGFTMSQGWHEIHRYDPGHRWFREELVKEAANKNADQFKR